MISLPYSITATSHLHGDKLSCESIQKELLKQPTLIPVFAAAMQSLQENGLHRLQLRIIPTDIQEIISRLDLEGGTFECTIPEFSTKYRTIEFVTRDAMSTTQGDASLSREQRVQQLELFLRFASTAFCALFGKRLPTRPSYPGSGVFDFGLFVSYMKQLKEFVKSRESAYPLLFVPDASSKQLYQHRAISLVRHIMDFDEAKKGLWAVSHTKTLNFLRQVLKGVKKCGDDTLLHKQIQGFTQELSSWFFTGPNLEAAWQLILLFKSNSFEKSDHLNVVHAVNNVYNEVLAKFEQVKIENRSSTDLHILGYLPSKLWTVPHPASGKLLQALRMPNATYRVEDERGIHFRLMLEFKAFIRALSEQGKRLLYINLMSTSDDKNRGILEGMMSNAIHSAEFLINGKTVVVYSFDRNSDFYYQEKEFSDAVAPELKVASHYKMRLHKHLLDTDRQKPCQWSWQKHSYFDLVRDIEVLIRSVHSHYFENVAELTESMRRVFNELVFLEFADHELEQEGYDFFTAACQASADRGPSFMALWYLKLLIKSNLQLDVEAIKRLVAMLLTNAMLTEHRLPYQDRVQTFMNAAELMLKRGPMPKLLIKLA